MVLTHSDSTINPYVYDAYGNTARFSLCRYVAGFSVTPPCGRHKISGVQRFLREGILRSAHERGRWKICK